MYVKRKTLSRFRKIKIVNLNHIILSNMLSYNNKNNISSVTTTKSSGVFTPPAIRDRHHWKLSLIFYGVDFG